MKILSETAEPITTPMLCPKAVVSLTCGVDSRSLPAANHLQIFHSSQMNLLSDFDPSSEHPHVAIRQLPSEPKANAYLRGSTASTNQTITIPSAICIRRKPTF
jgi:hypothetical protein